MLNQDTFQPQNFLILVVDDASKNEGIIGYAGKVVSC